MQANAANMNPAPPVLEVAGLSKSFPGVRALHDVRFDVHAGEVHALLGENGAGKSTLIKIVSGVYRPDAGTVRVDGREVHFAGPQEAQAAGIATVFQELLLFPDLSVAENIFLGPCAAPCLGRRGLAGDARPRRRDPGLARDPRARRRPPR